MRALRRYRVGIALVGLLVLVGMLVAYRLKEQQARALPRARGDALVGVAKAERRDLEVKVASTADILPSKQAAIFSKVSGYIRRIHADRGDFVVETRKGALTIPVDALRIGEAKPTVMVVRAGVAEAVPIAVGLADGERVEVVSGLADDDQVATVFTLILIPTLYVILEERFPREAPAPEGALTPQGEIA